MMTCAVHPELQRELLTAQSLGSNPETCFRTVINWIEARCSSQAGSLSTSLQGLMELVSSTVRVQPALLLQELVALTGQPALLGLLLARCLSWNVVTADELLSLPASPSLVAAAVVELHTALSAPTEQQDSGSQQEPSSAASAQSAFSTLIKLLVTASELEGGKQATEEVGRLLRAQWGASNSGNSSGIGFGGQAKPPNEEGALQLECGVQLLARLVRVVHCEVFPRSLATRWLEGELTAALQPPKAPPNHHHHHQQQQQGGHGGARQLGAGDTAGPAWSDAMAAFAAALPLPSLLAHVQRALLGSGSSGSGGIVPGAMPQQLDRCAQLLAAAAANSTQAAAEVANWVGSQAAAGLQRRDVVLVWGALQLQRRLCAGPQHYEAWLGGSLLAGEAGAQRDVQFLVQSVLIPMLPEEIDAPMLEAQSHALAGQADLSTSATRLVQEYRSAAQQRRHALQQQQQQQDGRGAAAAGAAGGGAALSGPAAANLERAQVQAELLLREFQLSSPGRLSPGTLQDLAARAANPFQKGAVINQLVPALLRPTAEPGEVEARVALLEHLFRDLPPGPGAATLRPHFKPDAVQRFRQACQLAQLESAALPQLSAALEQAMGAAAGRGGPVGGPSPHQLLDRLGRVVEEEVQAYGKQGGAAVATDLQALLSSLLNTFHAAYASCLASPAPGRACLGVAVHLLRTIHAHRELHGLLLGRVEELVLVAGPAGQLDAQQALSLSMLVAAIGALLAAQPPGMHQQHPPPVPLFTWQPGSASPPLGTSAIPTTAAATAAAEVAGPDWLRQLLAGLSLRSAGHMLWGCRFTAALLSCLRHYSCFVQLSPMGPSTAAAAAASLNGGGRAGQLGPLVRLHGSGLGPSKLDSYDGEWLRRLAYPLCPAAVCLLQWLQLRVGVAGLLAFRASFANVALGQATMPGAMDSGMGEEGRLGKRPRLQQGRQPEVCVPQAGAAEHLAVEGGEVAQHAEQLCQAVLGGELGQGLVQDAGPLPLATFLQLEAAAAAGSVNSSGSCSSGDSGSSDLVPPLSRDAMIRAVCSEFLRLSLPSAPSGAAAPQPAQQPHGLPLLQSLLASETAEQGQGLAQGADQVADPDCLADTQPLDEAFDGAVMATECVPDSQEEEEEGWGTAAAATAGGSGSGDRGGVGHGAGRGTASELHYRLARAAGEAMAGAVVWWAGDAAAGPEAQGTSAGERPGAGGVLCVLQAAAAHLLRLLLTHADGGRIGSDASSRATMLAHFVLGVIRGCQQGLPASVAVHGGPASGSLVPGSRGSKEGPGPKLQFEERAAQRAAALLGPLCRGLLLELLPASLFEGGLSSAAAVVEGFEQAVWRGLGDASLSDAQLLGELRQAVAA